MNRLVVMGVSGCGKSSIGAGLAKAIGARFIDGDALHPQTNIDKMRQGEPLTDQDRAPWLLRVGEVLRDDGTVVACSALKRVYRDLIRQTAGAPVGFLYLRGQRATLAARMAARPGHFMPPALLDSQLATLEPPTADECHLTVDIEQTPAAIIAELRAGLKEMDTCA
jgi:carbohydrate kinase (thermoresistant glucokinase family)